jgi:16S rRNA processing protein RimM
MHFIIAGKVIQPHGLKGWVKVAVTSENPLRFTPGNSLILEGTLRRLTIEETRPVQGCLHVKFSGVDDRDQAVPLKGRELWITEDEVGPPPEDSFWEHQLLGLRVETLDGERLGRVEDILVTGSNDVLIVKGEREVLIPLIRDVIRDIRLTEGVILIEPLPGLLE